MKSFFKFQEAGKKSSIRFKVLSTYDDVGLARAEWIPQGPLLVRVDEGKKFYDVLGYQDVFNFAISDRIHNLLIDEGINGWSSYPLNIEEREEKYWGIQVAGRAGPPIRPHEGFIDGLRFDESTWDGSDIFVLEGTVSILITQRLQQLLVRAKITNLALKEISSVRWYSATVDVSS